MAALKPLNTIAINALIIFILPQGIHDFYNFGSPFLGNYYECSVCLCPGEEVFERNNAFSLCDLYGHATV